MGRDAAGMDLDDLDSPGRFRGYRWRRHRAGGPQQQKTRHGQTQQDEGQ
jgi:hypothetical protein